MTCDLLDWCQGPEGDGCRFVSADHPGDAEDANLVGYCAACRVEVREIDG